MSLFSNLIFELIILALAGGVGYLLYRWAGARSKNVPAGNSLAPAGTLYLVPFRTYVGMPRLPSMPRNRAISP